MTEHDLKRFEAYEFTLKDGSKVTGFYSGVDFDYGRILVRRKGQDEAWIEIESIAKVTEARLE